MRNRAITTAVALLLGVSGTQAQAADDSVLFNKANAINYEQIRMAQTAKEKAGDNQGLTSFAETLEADHKANEDALTALSREKGVKMDGTPAANDAEVKAMDNLSGGAFNVAFLRGEIADNGRAIRLFEQARAEFAGDRDVELYIGQTLPVMQAHLEMAKGLERH